MTECSDEDMGRLIAAAQDGGGDALAIANRLIERHPGDARLHFLRGSFLAAANRPIEAHAALAQAVALAPDFALARFQLGLFELTSGEAARAMATWQPLGSLPETHYLTRFVAGLTHLIHDRFADAREALLAGIAVNNENLPLNRDMQLIVDQCAALLPTIETPAPGEAASATSFLLGQSGGHGTMH
ncbi:hypothetical protein [Sphingomonas sp. Leaf4]|uniref:hypothetical protein n=1 Tax=Sphingomonas sp. Leaf4 TaxID=2876553 RepID=UPI001E426677|nr:hypothetical protein [Sphingomonas sp. Leaf4]